MTTSLYAQADPTHVVGYSTTQEGESSYALAFTVSSSGTLKQIGFYSPASATGVLPDTVGLFAADNTTALLEVTASWSGAMGSGWIFTNVPDTIVSSATTYFAVLAYNTSGNNWTQAYLYNGGSGLAWPVVSSDGKISNPSSTSGLANGPTGPTNPYVNSLGFSYPATAAPNQLSWLIDVSIQFGTPTPPTVTTSSLPKASRLYAYSASLAASGGTTPLTWAVTGGALPVGLSISSGGAITGTPTANGTASFTVTVTDSASMTATASLSITVSDVVVSQTGSSGGVTTYSVTAGINNTGSAGPQNMRVLQPTAPAAGRPHGFLWMLPVEPGQGTSFGDSMATALALGIHNTYNLTCIQPGFPVDPWYADNVSDTHTQQETFMIDMTNWAKANLASTGVEKHYLIGFSKSGFGGQLLFLKHQDVFQAVATWDNATDYATLAQYDGGPVFGTQGNLDNNKLYNPNLATWKAEGNTGSVNRIWLGAGINLVQATADYDARLTSDGILHTYSYVAADSHNWAPTPGWVAPAVAAMLGNPSSEAILGAVFI